MNKKIQKTKSKIAGITLIALVITIIVLLILAGVTINTLTGDNGILNQATKAKESTDKGEIKEQLDLAVLTSRMGSGSAEIDTSVLSEELDKLEKNGIIDKYTEDTEGSVIPGTAQKGKYEFRIDENGNLTEKDGGTTPNPDGGNPPSTGGEVTLKPTEGETADTEVKVTSSFGKIDVIWLDGKTNNPTTTPNKPILKSGEEELTPVKFDDTSDNKWVPADKSNTGNEWYNYEAGNTNNSHWANARTTNNSYFVWIPRYAYRITYYAKDPTKVTEDNDPTGYYDGYGMWNKDGEIKYELDKGIETTIYDEKSYIVHPAFMKDTEVTDKEGKELPDYERGGWSDDLEGFWFAKFEMGGSTAEALNSQFGTASIIYQNIGLQYENARKATYGYQGTYAEDIQANSFMNSHMVKNSEWGAVAYLTHSQYGLNGREIAINNNGSTFYRGGGTGDAYIEKTNQSTTGNVYGIYDMSGNAYEYVASYDKLSTSSYLTNTSYGVNLTKYAKDESDNKYISTKYITAYDNGTSEYSGTKIYNVGKVGDGTKETYLGTGSYGWFSDYAYFACSDRPFFRRGGDFISGSYAGVFYSKDDNGHGGGGLSFRAALCV